MSKSMEVAFKVAEKHVERELDSKISARMKASAQDAGNPDSLRHTILSLVTSENYTRAVDQLREHVESKSDFPQFKIRSERYLSYAVDLVYAIKAKRGFPGLQQLSMSKQQELFDRSLEHFEDLKVTLKKVEQIDREVRLDDVRSTVWVVKAVVYCVFAILVLAFIKEFSMGVLPTIGIVVEDIAGDIINFVFDKLGL